jgi:hypothetical protein
VAILGIVNTLTVSIADRRLNWACCKPSAVAQPDSPHIWIRPSVLEP